MELIKLDIRKSGIELTAEAKAEAARANDCSIRARAQATIFWVG